MWDLGQGYFCSVLAYGSPITPTPFVEQAILFPLNYFCTFVKKSIIFLWQYSYNISGIYLFIPKRTELSIWISDYPQLHSLDYNFVCFDCCPLISSMYTCPMHSIEKLCLVHNISAKLMLADMLLSTVLEFFSYFTII